MLVLVGPKVSGRLQGDCMKRPHLLRVSVVGNVFLLTVALAAQIPPSSQSAGVPAGSNSKSPQTTPAFESSSNLVLVDVVVTHNGEPVKGLQRDAFHVFEGGREQAVKVFEEHTAAEAAQIQKPSLPPATYSNFPDSTAWSANILLLDALN